MSKPAEPYIGAALDSLSVTASRVGHDKQAFMADPILQDATLMRLMDAGEQLSH